MSSRCHCVHAYTPDATAIATKHIIEVGFVEADLAVYNCSARSHVIIDALTQRLQQLVHIQLS